MATEVLNTLHTPIGVFSGRKHLDFLVLLLHSKIREMLTRLERVVIVWSMVAKSEF